jgi:hypothetical protein
MIEPALAMNLEKIMFEKPENFPLPKKPLTGAAKAAFEKSQTRLQARRLELAQDMVRMAGEILIGIEMINRTKDIDTWSLERDLDRAHSGLTTALDRVVKITSKLKG